MPGYEVIGFTGTWESTDALHCRIKGIPDSEMMQLFHNPLNDSIAPLQLDGYKIELDVDNLSNFGINQDLVKVFWKNDLMQIYDSSHLNISGITGEVESYIGYIPPFMLWQLTPAVIGF